MSVIYFILVVLISFFYQTYPISAQQTAEPVITIHGAPEYGLSYPSSIFVDHQNKRIYVADAKNNVLLLFNKDLEFLADFDNEGQLVTPISIIKDSRGRFYIAEAKSANLTQIDLDEEITKVLELGEGVIPGALSVDKDDNVFFLNRLQSSIFRISGGFGSITEIPIQKNQLRLKDIWVDEDGTLYTVDPIARKIFVFDQQGKLLLSFGTEGGGEGEFLFPVSISTIGNLVLVADAHRKKILTFNKDGKFMFEFGNEGIAEGQLSSPIFVRGDWEGRVYVINRDPPKIEVFRFTVN